MGAGAAMTVWNGQASEAQTATPGAAAVTRSGWKNDAGRASGNGPIDDTTRQIVRYVTSFSEANLTGPLTAALGDTMLDAVSSIISGFESEPARICARMARTTQSTLESTVLGYGVTTSPELAAFANGACYATPISTTWVRADTSATSFRGSSRGRSVFIRPAANAGCGGRGL